MAPSGVMMIGVALVLRDLVQRRLGVGFGSARSSSARRCRRCSRRRRWCIASAAAFLLSEFADLRRLHAAGAPPPGAAVVASSVVGLVVNSIVFLWLAFGSLDFLAGQIVGKAWMVLLSIPFVAWLRRRDERLGLAPA